MGRRAVTLDPEKWRESIRIPILGFLVVLMIFAVWLGPRSALAVIAVSVIPAVVGGLIWRFDGLPWVDILSWTVPLAAWVAVAASILPGWGAVGWILGGLSVWAWLYAFMEWTRVTQWWYRWLLRKPYPGGRGHSGGA